MTTPRILAEVTLPQILSYFDPSDPQLKLTLTLLDCYTPITIALADTGLFPIVNSINIQEADTGKTVSLPTVDVNRKTVPQYSLNADREKRFTTIYPGVHYIMNINFRPFGREIFTQEQIASMGGERYRLLILGVHLLNIGQRYTMRMKGILAIDTWMEGDKTHLIPGKWQPLQYRIPIVPAEAVSFQVKK